MIRTGTVIGFRNGEATVRVSAGRQSCMACNARLFCHELKSQPCLEISLAAPGPVQVGDIVELDLELPNQFAVSVIVFGLPLLGALCGGLAGYWYAPQRDIPALIGCGLGLVLGFIPAARAERAAQKKLMHARFRKVIQAHQPVPKPE